MVTTQFCPCWKVSLPQLLACPQRNYGTSTHTQVGVSKTPYLDLSHTYLNIIKYHVSYMVLTANPSCHTCHLFWQHCKTIFTCCNMRQKGSNISYLYQQFVPMCVLYDSVSLNLQFQRYLCCYMTYTCTLSVHHKPTKINKQSHTSYLQLKLVYPKS